MNYRHIHPVRYDGNTVLEALGFYPALLATYLHPDGSATLSVRRPGAGRSVLIEMTVARYLLEGPALREKYTGWHIDQLYGDRSFVACWTEGGGYMSYAEALVVAIEWVEGATEPGYNTKALVRARDKSWGDGYDRS